MKSKIKDNIFNRNIQVSAYTTDNGNIIVEGSLRDVKGIETYLFSKIARPKGPVHHMIVRMLIDRNLTIDEIEVKIPGFPHEECLETIDSLKQVEGMTVARGFTTKIKKLFGNGQGCSHLTELLISIAHTSLISYWHLRTTTPLSVETKTQMKKQLTDACWVWRKGGPSLKKFDQS